MDGSQVSLVLPPIEAEHREIDDGDQVGVLTWEPPDSNWNPWLNQPVIFEGAEEYQVIFSKYSTTILSCEDNQCSGYFRALLK